jgi:tRNA nucleotidyltransferase/poly(A) polymerase
MQKNTNKIKIDLPIVIFDIIQKIKKNGFDAYIVGGCLRDLILKREVND